MHVWAETNLHRTFMHFFGQYAQHELSQNVNHQQETKYSNHADFSQTCSTTVTLSIRQLDC